jgi:acetylornithine aminotransferase
MLEPIQGEGGVNPLSAGYLKALREFCDAHELLLILDEIQTGNGRTGSYFAYQQEGIIPDVVTTAKGLGNGFPIGACLAAGRAADVFSPGTHGSTYGGNPLGCATAVTVVETLNAGVIDAVPARGEFLRQALRDAFADITMVTEVRGQGLINGVQFDRPCGELVGLCRERGLLINVTAESVVRLIPPLVISEEEITILVERLKDAVLAFVAAQEAA